jgi:acyl carrier protein
LGVKREQLTPDSRIMEDHSADSLTVMEIVMAVEDRFGLSIPDERWEKVRTVRDLQALLADCLKTCKPSDR